jgi:hypothetical protein
LLDSRSCKAATVHIPSSNLPRASGYKKAMTRDPFYPQILAGLRGRLDPELFERCAADLLRTIYPTLVPLRGGNDAGMNGACADGQGLPFPEYLEQPPLQGAALAVVLQLHQPPGDLLTLALARADGWPIMIETLCLRGVVPEAHVLALLCHPNPAVVSAAANGEWHAAPPGSVRPALRAAWREAILRCPERVPEEAFEADPDLARDWLAARLGDESASTLWQEHDTARAAYTALTTEQRVELLGHVPEGGWWNRAVRNLVGEDPVVYRHLLAERHLWRHHLAPLRGWPSDAWASMARLAIDRGYSPEEVAEATHGAFRTCDSDYWARWVEAFKGLSTHANPVIWQGRVGRPPPGEELSATDPRRAVAEALSFFSHNAERMEYPRYRREGLPSTSSLVESLVGQFNARVKSRQKYWNRPEGAEAILQLRAAMLSEDGRLERYFVERPGAPYRRRETGG